LRSVAANREIAGDVWEKDDEAEQPSDALDLGYGSLAGAEKEEKQK